MMEIPRFWLKTLSPLCDGDFALAQNVLADEFYRGFYAEQSKAGRFVVMDNGFHELGHPLEIPELMQAADYINPSIIITPDKLDDYKWTLDKFFEMRSVVTDRDLGVVLQGVTPAERADFFMKTVKYAKMICLPFRRPRFEWFCDLLEKIPSYIQWPPRIHLLGVNELWELKAFRDKFDELGIPGKRITVDTCKPISWGIQRTRISEKMPTLRDGIPLTDLEKKAGEACMPDVMYNIAFLRKYL